MTSAAGALARHLEAEELLIATRGLAEIRGGRQKKPDLKNNPRPGRDGKPGLRAVAYALAVICPAGEGLR